MCCTETRALSDCAVHGIEGDDDGIYNCNCSHTVSPCR